MRRGSDIPGQTRITLFLATLLELSWFLPQDLSSKIPGHSEGKVDGKEADSESSAPSAPGCRMQPENPCRGA